LQGGFILAKATGDPSQAENAISHLRRYVELLFNGAGADPTKN
jgi:TetR/AcrR family transcriptional regulator, transcriptional repressor for nem operon